MADIVHWLESVERLAGDAYRAGASVPRDDAQFSAFLADMAKDEDEHAEMMVAIAEFARTAADVPLSDIRIDQETRDHVEGPLKELSGLLAEPGMSRDQLLDAIVRAEFAEWDDIYLYVVNSFAQCTRQFQSMAAATQSHKSRIELFLKSLPTAPKLSMDIAALPRVWKRKCLVVDDSELLRTLIANLLAKQALVETAANGAEALERTKASFFDAIVTDIQMPVLDGLGFYRKAIEENPDTAGRFVFITFDAPPGVAAFLRGNHLPLLLKPFEPDDLMQTVAAISGDSPGSL